MSKYRSSALVKVKERTRQPHYLWRGIGCVMMIVIPAMSISAGVMTIDIALEQGYTIPYQLLGRPELPAIFYRSSGLMTIFGPIARVNNFYAYVAASFIYMTLMGGVLSFVYALIYRLVGPSRYGPLDAPRPNVKVKTYKR